MENPEREVSQEILRIMDTYHEQEAHGSVDTPGGLENMGDVWNKFAEWESKLKPAAKNEPVEVTIQMLVDVGLNAFALQLFAESVAGKTDATTFRPFTFIFRNIKITMEPHGAVDARHH